MSSDTLAAKIDRMYAAVGSVTEPDLSKIQQKVDQTQGRATLRQDFNQGLDRAQLENKAYQVIRSIADMRDHLRAAARRLKRDPEEVEQAIDASLPLQLMMDLSNFDKHGALEKPARQRSKKSPRLINVRGALQIKANAGDIGPGGMIGLRMTPQGMQPFGAGKSAVVVTGDIVDADGRHIVDLEYAQTAAVEAWEALLARLGIRST